MLEGPTSDIGWAGPCGLARYWVSAPRDELSLKEAGCRPIAGQKSDQKKRWLRWADGIRSIFLFPRWQKILVASERRQVDKLDLYVLLSEDIDLSLAALPITRVEFPQNRRFLKDSALHQRPRAGGAGPDKNVHQVRVGDPLPRVWGSISCASAAAACMKQLPSKRFAERGAAHIFQCCVSCNSAAISRRVTAVNV